MIQPWRISCKRLQCLLRRAAPEFGRRDRWCQENKSKFESCNSWPETVWRRVAFGNYRGPHFESHKNQLGWNKAGTWYFWIENLLPDTSTHITVAHQWIIFKNVSNTYLYFYMPIFLTLYMQIGCVTFIFLHFIFSLRMVIFAETCNSVHMHIICDFTWTMHLSYVGDKSGLASVW